MEINWTRESALQAVENGAISTWAGEWLYQDQSVDLALSSYLTALRRDGLIQRGKDGRYRRVRAGDPR